MSETSPKQVKELDTRWDISKGDIITEKGIISGKQGKSYEVKEVKFYPHKSDIKNPKVRLENGDILSPKKVKDLYDEDLIEVWE